MIYKIGCFLIVFLLQFIFCDNSTWQTVVSSKQKFVIKKQSLNEERVKSSRVRGELGIIADSSKLSFFINWGDFANISDANIKNSMKKMRLKGRLEEIKSGKLKDLVKNNINSIAGTC